MAMNKHMLYKNIYMPDSQEAKQLAQLAEEKCKIPQVIGAIQSLHIPIVTTQSLAKVFNNSAGYSSAIMQCVVDPNYVLVIKSKLKILFKKVNVWNNYINTHIFLFLDLGISVFGILEVQNNNRYWSIQNCLVALIA